VGMIEQDAGWWESDEILTLEEIVRFYSKHTSAKLLRNYQCKFISEWAINLDVAIPKMHGTSLVSTYGLKERMQPYLWWNEAKQQKVELPDAKCWHYNPIAFTSALAGVSTKIPRDFNVRLSLLEKKELTPLSAPSYDGAATESSVRFRLEIEKNDTDQLFYEITVGNGAQKRRIVYREDASLRTKGSHEIKWDGHGDDNVLDTKVLRDPDLEVKATAILDGVEKTASLKLHNRPQCQWIDLKTIKGSGMVEIELRVDFTDGGARGVDEVPRVSTAEYFKWAASDPRRQQKHVRLRDFAALKSLAVEGLERYWGRNASNGRSVLTPDGTYTVTIKPVMTEARAMDDIALVYNTNRDWGRSSNPATVENVTSFFAQVVPEQIIYNVGFLSVNDKWRDISPSDADEEFRETVAHETGHEILQTYGGTNYSYGHRGSSTLITQDTKPVVDGGVGYPTTGDGREIDLMMYYNGYPPSDYYSRLVASEKDVVGLIWLSRVLFTD